LSSYLTRAQFLVPFRQAVGHSADDMFNSSMSNT
jgi:hypothetical protein